MPPRPSAPATALVSPDQFLKCLTDSALLPASDVQAVLSQMPAAQRHDARQLAVEFVRRGKLTRYQATMLYQGRSRGLVLGNYALLEKLGQGGMGMVFKAFDRRKNRTVAVKVLPPETQAPHAVQRFQREVRAAVQLDHPNIAAALASGVADGIHFFVMEYVEGSDLSRLVKAKGPLPVAQAVQCIMHAARGLAHAHAASIVHRDIKPSNLLLATAQTGGTVKILDLGLARLDAGNEPDAGAGDLTRPGSIMGTADYMAPEQAVNSRRADHRADIYSLGCTLYYLLTGQPLYAGETAIEKLLAHREQPVPSLRALRPDVPAPLDGLFRRMVAKRPEERPQSMAEVMAALEACAAAVSAVVPAPALPSQAVHSEDLSFGLEDTAYEYQPPTTIMQRIRQPRRGGRRWAVASAAALVLLTLLGLFLLRGSGRSAAKTAERVPLAGAVMAANDPSRDWVPLFNGKDLAGWHVQSGRPDVWRADAGILSFQDPPDEGWLVTASSYEDFDLRLEYRIHAGADSGVGLRLPPPGRGLGRNLEVQIRDEPSQPSTDSRADSLVTGSLCHLAAALRPSIRPRGQWNDMRITARGSRFTVELNGARTVEVDVDHPGYLVPVQPGQRQPNGPIGLQCFRGRADFRNIQVKAITR